MSFEAGPDSWRPRRPLSRPATLGDVSENADRPTRIIDSLTSTWRALSDVGAQLTEDQWKAPTDLPMWNVQDTLAHVIGTERFLQGLPPAPPLAGERPAHVHNPIGELNEREVAARRSRPGAEVLAEWDDLRALREQTLADAGPSYFAQPMDSPNGPGTLTDFLAVRILDCWVHEQDIRRAVGIPGNLDGPAAEHTVDRLIRGLPMVVGKRAACPEGAAVAFHITGGVERSLTCEVQGGRAAFVDTPSADPACTITVDTETFVMLATGRRPASELASRIVIDGERELGQSVVDGLNVMI
jgi:uncharacterized protein (TIGR03083 family)